MIQKVVLNLGFETDNVFTARMFVGSLLNIFPVCFSKVFDCWLTLIKIGLLLLRKLRVLATFCVNFKCLGTFSSQIALNPITVREYPIRSFIGSHFIFIRSFTLTYLFKTKPAAFCTFWSCCFIILGCQIIVHCNNLVLIK